MIYSVYWDDERVTVVDAPGVDAVDALIRRHVCQDDGCDHCALFSFLEGSADGGMKPARVTGTGYSRLSWPWWVLIVLFLPLGIPLLVLRLAFWREPQAYWPTHP